MNKKSILNTLKKAKESHQKWVDNALLLIKGAPLDKSKVPVDATKCVFGKWYYSHGQALNHLPGFTEIEHFHNKLHKKYQEIFGLLFDEEAIQKPSFFQKFFGLSQKLEKEKKQQAIEKYGQLVSYSEHIIKQLEHLEKLVDAMTDEQLARYTTQK